MMNVNRISLLSKIVKEANKSIDILKKEEDPLAQLHMDCIKGFLKHFRIIKMFIVINLITLLATMIIGVFFVNMTSIKIVYVINVAIIGYTFQNSIQQLKRLKIVIRNLIEVTDHILDEIRYQQSNCS